MGCYQWLSRHLVIFVMSILKWNTASDVTAVVGTVTGVIGTIVGAFFGVQMGSAGKEKAENARKDAEDKAFRMAAAMPPEMASKFIRGE